MNIIDEIRATERKLVKADNEYQALCAFLEDAGDTLSEESVKAIDAQLRRLDSICRILIGNVAMLESDLEETSKEVW